MRLFKRGTEKPIEIFVALFIILAVAMLLLKMMRDQTAGSEKQLKDAQRQQAMADYTQAAQKACTELCDQARDTGCSPKAVARYCLAKYHAPYLAVEQYGYDVDRNYEFNELSVEDVGFAVCETNIYCSQMTLPPCGCKGGLTMERCVKELCDYYASVGISPADQLSKNIAFGSCSTPAGMVKWIDKLDLNADGIMPDCPP
jgi:hypothetical protein